MEKMIIRVGKIIVIGILLGISHGFAIVSEVFGLPDSHFWFWVLFIVPPFIVSALINVFIGKIMKQKGISIFIDTIIMGIIAFPASFLTFIIIFAGLMARYNPF